MTRREQRVDALARANVVRTACREYKERIGALPRADALRDAAVTVKAPAGSLGRLKVVDLLRAVPAMGHVRAGSTMRRCGISATTRVDGLTELRRATLVRWLLDEAVRVERQTPREECRAA